MAKDRAKSTTRISVDFDNDIYDRLKAISAKEKRSLISQVKYVVEKWLETQPKELRP